MTESKINLWLCFEFFLKFRKNILYSFLGIGRFENYSILRIGLFAYFGYSGDGGVGAGGVEALPEETGHQRRPEPGIFL